MICHLVKTRFVEAAHRNPAGGEPQARLHGHTYRIDILAGGEPSLEVGWIVDFAELKQAFQPIEDKLDHSYLNELPGLEEDASLTALQQWIERRLQPWPPWLEGVRVRIVGDCRFAPRRLDADPAAHLPERWYFTFEAAQSLPQLPHTHHCHAVHGHSYRMEIGVHGMDAVRSSLEALYLLLDHRYLNELPGLDQATTERLCRWVWNWLFSKGHVPNVVVVQETESSRCVYYGD